MVEWKDKVYFIFNPFKSLVDAISFLKFKLRNYLKEATSRIKISF